MRLPLSLTAGAASLLALAACAGPAGQDHAVPAVAESTSAVAGGQGAAVSADAPPSATAVTGGQEATGSGGAPIGFTMPPPGTFDPNAPGYKPFKPCEDIPDEVFEQLGLKRVDAAGTTYEPYFCQVDDGSHEGMDLTLSSWKTGMDSLTSINSEVVEVPDALPGSVTMIPTNELRGPICDTALETAVGTVVVGVIALGYIGTQESLCSIPNDLMKKLYHY
ncbi:DUF3558 family protein [Corynebacterium lizhenjunii]|uniref:DUF3558 family protein n=1 Tax=Corynebacterium lizhenjunii TaxID=2709394 RepID=A0A7T0PBQ8_9CORY|nr:DUF3558 family protein [Corynebacterium lizhenjunii]QPK78767.1 DUF3558 family protein [Corynebacterium lizhenjunii]